jgi:hypothetical protein
VPGALFREPVEVPHGCMHVWIGEESASECLVKSAMLHENISIVCMV